MSAGEIRAFIEHKQIRYVFIEKNVSRILSDLFIKKHRKIGFHQIAEVGGWLFVYVRDDPISADRKLLNIRNISDQNYRD